MALNLSPTGNCLELMTRYDLPSYDVDVVLDGTAFNLSYKFNQRMGYWFIGLNDPFGNIIVAPVPVIVMWPLFDRFIECAIPLGRIFAYDTTNTNTDPGRFDLGNRVRIFYDQAATTSLLLVAA